MMRLLSSAPSAAAAACYRHRKSFLLLVCLLWFLPLVVQAETEVTWTPNEQDQQADAAAGSSGGGGGGGGSGPLPLSQQQRQQLLQLDQTIAQSPNPQETLEQAAAANQMNPRDLQDILVRNRNDMAQGAGGGGGSNMARTSPKNVLVQALTSLVLVIGKMARHHPQTFSITTLVVILCLYALWTAPRTGLVLSSARRGGSILSHGPTTLWSPPNTYLRRLLEQQQQDQSSSASSAAAAPLKSTSTMWKEMNDLLEETDSDNSQEAVWHKVGKRTVAPSLQQAVSCEVTLDMNDLLPSSSSSTSSRPQQQQQQQRKRPSQQVEEEEDEDADSDEAAEAEEEADEEGDDLSYMLDMAYDQAFRLLLEQHGPLTEFVDPPDSVRFVTLDGNGSSSRRQKGGLLVVRGLGDWKRFGICPMQVTQQAEDYSGDDEKKVDESNNNPRIRLTWSTLREKSHWDGHVQIQVEKQESDGKLVVRVLLLAPVKNKKSPSTSGRKVASKSLTLHIVQALANSIATSLKQRTKLQVARQSQSNRYRGQAAGRAQQRRHSRLTKERQMEEMAADRRRRWQRQNPNSGHYRPSGTRMQSPNNAVYN